MFWGGGKGRIGGTNEEGYDPARGGEDEEDGDDPDGHGGVCSPGLRIGWSFGSNDGHCCYMIDGNAGGRARRGRSGRRRCSRPAGIR